MSGRPNDDSQADMLVASDPLSAPGSALKPILAGQHRHPGWSSQSEFVVFAFTTAPRSRRITPPSRPTAR